VHKQKHNAPTARSQAKKKADAHAQRDPLRRKVQASNFQDGRKAVQPGRQHAQARDTSIVVNAGALSVASQFASSGAENLDGALESPGANRDSQARGMQRATPAARAGTMQQAGASQTSASGQGSQPKKKKKT